MEVAAASPDGDKKKSTRERLDEARNMTVKEVTEYLASKEFAQHGSRSIATNARRLNAIVAGNAKNVSLEDSELMRNAISAIDRAKYASGHEMAEAVTKARAYGFDAEKDEKGGESMGATASEEKVPLEDQPDGSVDDDDDEESDDDDEE